VSPAGAIKREPSLALILPTPKTSASSSQIQKEALVNAVLDHVIAWARARPEPNAE